MTDVSDQIPTSTPTQQPLPQPAGPAQPGRAPALTDDPGFALGVASLVSAFFVSIVGLVLGIIAMQQSRQAGFQNPTAIAGIIVSAAMSVLTVVIVLFSIVLPLVFMAVFFAAFAWADIPYQQ